jgi:dGTPase
LLEETRAGLSAARIGEVSDVKSLPEPLVQESKKWEPERKELHDFLHQYVYHHDEVVRMAGQGRECISQLFAAYVSRPDRLPGPHAARAREIGPESAAGDYLAGMTDRFAMAEKRRLFQSH